MYTFKAKPMNSLLVIDAIPYISKFIEEEINLWRDGVDSFLAVASVSSEQKQSLRQLADKVKEVSFECSITFDVSELISWNFMEDCRFLDEDEHQDYLISVMPEIEDWGSDIINEKAAIALPNPPASLMSSLRYIPLYQKPKSKKNVDLVPPAWVTQSVKLEIDTRSPDQGFLTWDIWERTMSVSTSDGERYFMLESRSLNLNELLAD